MPSSKNPAAAAAAKSYAGFDTSVFPGHDLLKSWKPASPYTFVGYYLPSPCHRNATWSGTREKLTSLGYGIALIYVGRQAQGPGSATPPSARLGSIDGADAAAKCGAEGFPAATVIFLDVEPMEQVPPAMKSYLQAWCSTVLAGGFVPGVYCHVKNAAELRAAVQAAWPKEKPAAVFWVSGSTSKFDLHKKPADSGISFARMWQGRLDFVDTHAGKSCKIDANVADVPNPSAIYVTGRAAPVEMAPAAAPEAPAVPQPPGMDQINEIIARNLPSLKKPGVIEIRPGYQITGGVLTRKPAIVVTVLEKKRDIEPAKALPARIEGMPVDVRQASVAEQAAVENPALAKELFSSEEYDRPQWDFAYGALAETAVMREFAVKPEVEYEPPADATLDAVEDVMSVVCHTSPDDGWPNLKAFLQGTEKRLTIGMYDFNAQHIVDALASDVENRTLTMVLDANRAGGQGPDEHDTIAALRRELGERFQFAWAAVNGRAEVDSWVFPSAYHIKVAVRDGEAFWLSSGNWQNSNQPDIDPLHNAADQAQAFRSRNREWHAIVEHRGLAATFEKFLQQDFKQASQVQASAPASLRAAEPLPELALEGAAQWIAAAARPKPRFFEPLVLTNERIRVQPLLTPDNYAKHVLRLIQSAQKTFYMQTQYIHADEHSPARFMELVNAVRDRIAHGVDVKIILRDIGDIAAWIEKLATLGFDTSVIRLQQNVHNKGVVVDSSVAMLGSHNWSGDGTLRNRDASLIFFHSGIARYYEQIFLHDWTRLATPAVSEPRRAAIPMGRMAASA